MLLRQVQADPLQGHHLRQVRRGGHPLQGPPRADGPHPAGQPGQPHLVLQGHAEPARASCSTSARATSSGSCTSRCTSSPTWTRTRASAPWRRLEDEAEGRGGKGGKRAGRARGRAALRHRTSQQDELDAELARTKADLEAQRTARTEEIAAAAKAVEAQLAALKPASPRRRSRSPRRARSWWPPARRPARKPPPRLRKIVGDETERVNAELQQREADEARAVEQKIADLRAAIEETLARRARASSQEEAQGLKDEIRKHRDEIESLKVMQTLGENEFRDARREATARAPRAAACSGPAWAPRPSARSSAGWTSRSSPGPSTSRSGPAPASAARRRSSGSASSRRSAAPAPGPSG